MTAAARVAVVVLGDLGRSPRMQYHALALADDGYAVDFIGYAGRPPDRAVSDNPSIRVTLLGAPLRNRVPAALFAPAAAADLAWQSASLFSRLVAAPRPDLILVQNPPSFPTLPVALAAAAVCRARLIVDWHNFGADMLALRLGRGREHAAVRMAEAAERALGQRAHAHLCVSRAMRAALAQRFGIAGAHVLYDRPAKRPTPTARGPLLGRLGLPQDGAVAITSSSWSDDEDFGLLVDAMVVVDALLRGRPDLPALTLVMTGDGPRRAHWEARFAAAGLVRVRPRTLWASAEDYPLLLAAADVGLSLHRSASGVDLPMKVSDMFGAGLPVLALDYGPVVRELVEPGVTGRLFSDAATLAGELGALLADPAALAALRAGVARTASRSWQDGWRDEARMVFRT